MPELPDVEAVRRHLLAQDILGRRIVGVELNWPRAVRFPTPKALETELPGRRIEALERRAKFLLFRLDRGTLVVHLRMTGALEVVPLGEPVHPHVRNLFPLDDGRTLWFVDARKLGQIWLVEELSPLLARLGPEPLTEELSPDPGFTLEGLASRLQRRSAPIKPLLLEQDVAAGVGNIYADEILFAAGIHPLTPARDMPAEQVALLHQSILEVLARAVRALAPIMPVLGPPTESREGLQLLQVPRHEGEPCRRCETPIERRVIRGRSAYFCPRCQPGVPSTHNPETA